MAPRFSSELPLIISLLSLQDFHYRGTAKYPGSIHLVFQEGVFQLRVLVKEEELCGLLGTAMEYLNLHLLAAHIVPLCLAQFPVHRCLHEVPKVILKAFPAEYLSLIPCQGRMAVVLLRGKLKASSSGAVADGA